MLFLYLLHLYSSLFILQQLNYFYVLFFHIYLYSSLFILQPIKELAVTKKYEFIF